MKNWYWILKTFYKTAFQKLSYFSDKVVQLVRAKNSQNKVFVSRTFCQEDKYIFKNQQKITIFFKTP